jgi:dipeptidyl aminopeptidase/acylaminoacyl peptidase
MRQSPSDETWRPLGPHPTDVQNVYANFDIPESVMAELADAEPELPLVSPRTQPRPIVARVTHRLTRLEEARVTKGRAATRWWAVALVGIVGSLGLVGCSDGESSDPPPNEAPQNDTTGATVSVADGRIAFVRGDPEEEQTVTYTVNPDGSDEAQLFSGGQSQEPRWSPTGREISILCCDDPTSAAHVTEPNSGDLIRALPASDPTLEMHCGFGWSPDGERIACEVYGLKDEGLNGIYSIRASDGAGLKRITSNPGGGDIPGGYSPDGTRLVFVRRDENGPVGIFVTNLDGSGAHRISPPGALLDDFDGGTWSPDGGTILFEVRASDEHHSEIWAVAPDGSAPHELPIDPACGGLFTDPDSAGCFDPAWSPDGSKIVFARSNAGGEANLYIVNVDGTGLVQVTDGGFDHQPDWGMPPTGV